jgi:hypothetical protein
LLNRDENYLFDSPAKDPFLVPSRSTNIGDINKGRCYRKTYEALVKEKDVDMLLPAIVAMDKMQVDTYGWLQMEPITISHGLTKHSICSKHTAMQILGYICHSPAHQPVPKASLLSSETHQQTSLLALLSVASLWIQSLMLHGQHTF